MDFGRIVYAILGFSASFFLFLPSLKHRQKKKITIEKLRIIGEALENAEDRVTRYEERHDRILNQICSCYLINRELEASLAGSRSSMNEAFEYAGSLRKLHIMIISSFPDDAGHSSRLELQYRASIPTPANS